MIQPRRLLKYMRPILLLVLMLVGFIRLDLGGVPLYSFQMTLESLLLSGLMVSLLLMIARVPRFLLMLVLLFCMVMIKAYAKFYADYASLDDLLVTGFSAGEGLRTLPSMQWRTSEIAGALAFIIGGFFLPRWPRKHISVVSVILMILVAAYNLAGLSLVKGSPYALHSPTFHFLMGGRERPVIADSDRRHFRLVSYRGLGYDRVVVVTLESVRSDLAKIGLMPNLERLQRIGQSFKNFTNTTQTIRAEIAIYCSGLDNIYGYTYAQSALKPRDCLPAVLRQAGWQTAYFHGNTGEFFNRSRFLPLIGFDYLCFEDCMSAAGKAEMIGWGVSDVSSIAQGLAHVESAPRPSFTAIMTLTNHFPFHDALPVMDVEHEKIRANLSIDDPLYKYKMGHLYTDHALGQVLEFARNMDSRTLLVVTGDHGLFEFTPGTSEATRQYDYMRVPLLIIGSRLTPRAGISSHLDIAPTILRHVGGRMKALGDDLFDDEGVVPSRLIPAAKMGYPGFVSDAGYCFSSPGDQATTAAYQRDRLRFLHPEQTCQCISHDTYQLRKVGCDQRFKSVLGLHEFFSEEVNH